MRTLILILGFIWASSGYAAQSPRQYLATARAKLVQAQQTYSLCPSLAPEPMIVLQCQLAAQDNIQWYTDEIRHVELWISSGSPLPYVQWMHKQGLE